MHDSVTLFCCKLKNILISICIDMHNSMLFEENHCNFQVDAGTILQIF